jgi:hypothetical protein
MSMKNYLVFQEGAAQLDTVIGTPAAGKSLRIRSITMMAQGTGIATPTGALAIISVGSLIVGAGIVGLDGTFSCPLPPEGAAGAVGATLKYTLAKLDAGKNMSFSMLVIANEE